MRVVILGTSPPQSAIHPDRAGTGILVSIDDSHLLLDCGPRVTQRVAEAGVDVRTIEHVFLTHHHWDHISDLPTLVLGRWERSVLGSANGDPLAASLTIHGPPPTARIVGQLFSTGGVRYGWTVACLIGPEEYSPLLQLLVFRVPIAGACRDS